MECLIWDSITWTRTTNPSLTNNHSTTIDDKEASFLETVVVVIGATLFPNQSKSRILNTWYKGTNQRTWHTDDVTGK